MGNTHIATTSTTNTTTTTMTTALDSLKQYTTVVSDTGDFEGLEAYKPQDGTTNPSLILAAVKDPKYGRLIDVAVKYAKEKGGDEDAQVDACLDRLLVEFGKEILAIVPGRRPLLLRQGCDSCQGPPPHRALRVHRHPQGPDPDQDCLHLGGYPSCPRARGQGWDPLQPDPPLRLRPGGRLRRGKGYPHLPLCRTYS